MTLDGEPVERDQVVSKADIDAGKLVLTPAANLNTKADSSGNSPFLAYRVSDGKEYSTATSYIRFRITPVPDPTTGKFLTQFQDTRRSPGATVRLYLNGIEDADGLPATMRYQFQRVDADGVSNPVDLESGTAAREDDFVEYTLVAADVGKRIRAIVSFTDGGGEAVTLTTRAPGTVLASGVTDSNPSGANATVTLAEDGSYTFRTGNFGFTDSNPEDVLVYLEIASEPGAGTLRLGKGALAFDSIESTASVHGIDIAAGLLTYTPEANGHGDPYTSFTFSVFDDDYVAGSGADRYTMTIDVTPVNDAPTGRPAITGARQVGQTLTASTAGIADADGLPATLSYRWMRVDTDGVSNPIGIVEANASTYTLATSELGKRVLVRVTYTDDDGTTETLESAPSGVVQASGATNTAPEGADRTLTIKEDTARKLTVSDFGFTDADTGDALAGITVVTLPVRGALTLGGAAVAANQAVSAHDLQPSRLVFTPEPNAHGAGHARFTVTVSDGTDESASANTVTFDVTSVNDTPTGRPTVSGRPRVGQVLRADSAGMADVEGMTMARAGATGHALAWQWVRVDADGTSNPTDIANATSSSYLLTTADAGKRIRVKARFTDDAGTAEGPVESDAWPPSGTVRMTGAANTAPAGTNVRIMTGEETDYVFEARDFGFSDPDAGDTLAKVKVVTLPGKGALTLAGTAVTADQDVTVGDIDAGKLKYNARLTTRTGAAEPSLGYTSFTFKVSDGTADSVASSTVTFDLPGRPGVHGVTRVPARLVGSLEDVLYGTALRDMSPSAYSFQWTRVDGATETDIPGATSLVYHLRAADAGKRVKLKATFTDARGRRITAVRPFPDSGTILAPSPACAAPVYRLGTVEVWKSLLKVGHTSSIGEAYGTVLGLTTTEDIPYGLLTNRFFRIGSTSYEVSAVDTREARTDNPNTLEFRTSPGLTMEQRQKLVLHVCGRAFPLRDGDASAQGQITKWTNPNMVWDTTPLRTLRMSYDEAPPTLLSTQRAGAKVTLTFSENLDGDSLPAASAFAVKAGGTAASLASSNAVTITGRKVTLTLASAPASGSSVTVAYTKPTGTGAKPLRDLAHNEVADFGERSANHAPTIPNTAPVDFTTAEDTPYVLSVSDFGFADADAGDTLASVRISFTFFTVGRLVLGGVTVPEGAVIPRADIDAGRLRFVPVPGLHTDGFELFHYRVSDGKDESTGKQSIHVTIDAVNDPPTGKPAITGTRRAGQTLTAATDGIEDPDGPPDGGFRFTYQWIQVDADGASNPTEIPRATGSTYTLGTDDVGKRIAVRVSFTDADGTTERVTSDATGTIQAQGATNAAPTGAGKTVTTAEDVPYAFQVADFGFADGDAGDTLQGVTVVTLPSEGALTVGGAALAAGASASATDIALGRFLFTPAAHAHGDPYASFTFKVSDGTADSADTYTMTVDVTSVNDPATGKPEIMGTRQVGQTLTASTDDIDDAEGLPVTLGYQWVRVDADGTSNPTDISGATASSYMPVTDDVGKRLRVRVSFTDLDGNAESVSSELTGAIQASGTANAAPTAADFTILASTEPGYTFRTADFGFADTNMGDVLTSVTVVTVPRLGRLALGGTAVRPRQVVNATDIDAGRLVYAAGREGGAASGHASFTFRVSDGSDESASAHAVTIDKLGEPQIVGDIATQSRLRVPATLTAFTDRIPVTAGTTPAGGYAYQWVRVDGSTQTDIAGATEASYTLTPADTGKQVRLKVLFDDPRGVRVTATSRAYPLSGSILGPAACAMPVLAGGATQVWSADLRTFETIDLASSLRYGYGGDNGSLSDDEVEVGTSRYSVELVSDAYDGVGGQFGFRTSPALHGAHRQRLVLHICDAALALRDATESGGTYTWRDTALDWSGNVIVQRDLYLSYDDAAPTLSESARTGAAVTLTFSEALDSGAVPAASAFGITVNGTAATLAATSPVAIADETVTLTLATVPPVGATVAVTYTKPATGAKLRDPAHNDVATFTEEIVVAANSELGALALSDGRLDPLFDPAHATYTASVDHATARITVTASPRHPDGTVQYLDSADAALADAEPGTDGHQVDLDAGANTIKVKVTSGDRARTSTYTLTVTRKAGDAPSMPRAFTAAAAPGKAYLAWQAPATDGGSAIARYEYRYRTGTASYPATWTQVADGADPGTSAADERFVTVTGLANDQAHTFELRAVNAANQTSAAAESATVTPTAGHDCGVPSYPSGTRQVLIAQMVAGTGTGTATGSSHSLRGFLGGPGGFGTLSATAFTLGADTYTLDFVGEAAGSDHFFFSMDRFPSDAQLQRLTVYVCRKAYRLIGDPKVSRSQAERTFFIDDGEIGLDDRPVRVVRIAYRADATDATLGSLALEGATLDPAFAPATTEYTASVELATTRTTVEARPAEPGATVAYLDDADEAITDADTETDGHQVDLAPGDNVIKVKVTATNTTSTKTYRVTVRRGDGTVSDDASLSALTVSPGTLAPVFDAETTAYAVELIFSEREITVTAEPTDSGATVEYLKGDATLADANDMADGHQVSLDTGENVIKVKVTAEDGTTTEYTVTVRRDATASTDATLSGLTLSPGTLVPTFAADTTAYTASVGNAHDEVTVTPTVKHRGATVEYLDGDDATLADANDMADGHQVTLEVGENVVKVKVTAEDGTTTETYTVTLTRAEPPECPVPDLAAASREAVWTATVTVGQLADTLPDDTTRELVSRTIARGYESWGTAVGSLSSTSFTLGEQTYDVSAVLVYEDREWESSRLLYGYDEGALLIVVDDKLEDADGNDLAPELTLHVCDEPFTLNPPTALYERFDKDIHAYSWAAAALDWATVTERTVTLSKPASGEAQAGPAVVGLPTVSAPGDEEGYAEAERIEARIEFDQAVTVDTTDGTPTLGLALGGVRREAAYESGSGTTGLVFAYAAVEADAGGAQAKAIANGIVLNGATIRDEDGTDAVLDFGEAPGVASVEIGDPPGGDGAWDPNDALAVALVFEEPVEVDTDGGTPSVRALVGAGEKTLAYARGAGTNRLVFTYTLAKGDGKVTSVLVLQDSLSLNDGTIKSTAGLDATLTHNGAARAIGPREALPVVSVADAQAAEGATLGFVVTLAPAAASTVTVDWATADGTATAGADYTGASGTVTFAAGDTEKTVSVATTADEASDEAAETLIVTLSNASGATVGDGEATGTITEPDGPVAFTGSFANAPPEHDGASAFTLEFSLSEQPRGLGWRTVKDHLFDVTGGAIERAERIKGRVRNTAWLLTVAPSGNEKVTLTLQATTACASEHDVCTTDERMLAGGATATVPGPAALSVADAEADEEPGATLAFVVTLDRARHAAVSVDYATGGDDDTATAGSDYTAAQGTLTFAAGETSKTVKVTVLDDSHDDDGETVTFTLSNPQGARIEDGEATGTIRNSDAMPKAWLARFGRTVAEQVLVAVDGRMTGGQAPGAQATIRGVPLGAASPEEREALERREAEWRLERLLHRMGDEAQDDDLWGTFPAEPERELGGRELLTGSSFALSVGGDETGLASVWGLGAVTSFDGREGDLTLSGEVASAFIGAELSRGPTMGGLVIGHSRGDGEYHAPSGGGEVASTITGLYPWARHWLNDNVALWGAAGYGTGTLELVPEGSSAITADMDLAMAAVGLRGVLVRPGEAGGLELTAKTDALAVRTSSGEGEAADGGNLAPTKAMVTRLRAGLQGTWHGLGFGGGTLVPMLELGARHDAGDAETGYGADIGAGLAWSDTARGLTAEVRARGLLAHEARGFGEHGFSGGLSFDPTPGPRGLSLTVTQSVGGAASGGADALLGRTTLEGLGGADEAYALDARRLDVTAGYGFSVLEGHFVSTPEVGLALSQADREIRMGWRLDLARSDTLAIEAGIEAARRESAYDETGPQHAIGLRLSARW